MGVYLSMDGKKVINDEDAFDNAVDEVSHDEKLKVEFVEWFYSGDWVRED